MSNTKKCSNCKEIKELSNFHWYKTRWGAWCKACKVISTAAWRKKNPKKHAQYARTSRLRNKYKITNEEYNQMYQSQHGLCKICHQFEIKLNIDHCHRDGNVRGLLCNGCNHGLGMLQDDDNLLQRAIQYLNEEL